MERPNLSPGPRFPVELEREIFEVAATQRPIREFEGLVKMMLVARRVYEWIKPILYRVMVVYPAGGHSANYPPTHASTALPLYPQYGGYIRNLLLGRAQLGEAMGILKSCPQAQNVALWMIMGYGEHPEFCSILKTMPIQRLAVDIQKLFETPRIAESFVIDPTIFTCLTHLELIWMDYTSWPSWQPLTLIPTLSHLAIDEYNTEFLHNFLTQSQWLELLIVFVNPSNQELREKIHQTEENGYDERLVLRKEIVGSLSEWERGAHGHEDFWVFGEIRKAEKISLARQFSLLRAHQW